MKYVNNPIIAKPNFCVPAVLQMVLEHYGYYMDQEAISKQFVVIDSDTNVDHATWGTQIKSDSINRFFVNNSYCLKEEYIHIGHFEDEYCFEEAIIEKLQRGMTLICGYNYTWLFGNMDDSYRHVSIIVNYSKKDERVRLLDPGPERAGYKDVPLYDLYRAIRAGRDGLWCIHKAS